MSRSAPPLAAALLAGALLIGSTSMGTGARAQPPIEHLPAARIRALSAALRAQLDAPDRDWARPEARLAAAEAVGEWVVLRAEPVELQANFRVRENLEAFLLGALGGAEAELGNLSLDFLVVLTAVPVAAPEAVYLPLANDVRGIGYGHLGLAPDEVFRSGAAPRLAGLVFLNDLHRHLPGTGDAARGRYLFLHELGHRFGAYAQYRDAEGQRRDDWLGRDCAHWSHLASTAGSALEGNRWAPQDPADPLGVQVAEGSEVFTFAPMDRYLMGFLPAAAAPAVDVVGPLRAQPCTEPSRNGVPNASWAPPLWTGESARSEPGLRRITVEHLQAAEGARSPAWPEVQWRFRAVFVLVLGPDTVLSPAKIEAAEDLRRDWTATWMAAAAPEPAWRAASGERPLLVTTRDGVADVPLPVEAPLDAGVEDSGPADVGVADGTAADAVPADARLDDGPVLDAEVEDRGFDARHGDARPDAETRADGGPATRTGGGGGCAVVRGSDRGSIGGLGPGCWVGWLLGLALRRRRRL